MRSRPWLVVLLVVVALVGAACSDDNTPSGGSTTAAETSGETSGATTEATSGEGGQITINGDAANDHGSADVSGKDETEVELDDFYFGPTTLTGTAGQQVKLELKNEGGVEHNFTLEDQDVDQDVEAGEDASVMVTFPDSGVLEFFCKYHRSMGMVGQLQAS